MTTSIPALFATKAEENPGGDCLVSAGDVYSYEQMAACVVALARQLERDGVGPGDHVSIMLPRSQAYLVAQLAVLALGAVAVPLGMELTAGEVAADTDYCDVGMAICSAESAPRHPPGLALRVVDTALAVADDTDCLSTLGSYSARVDPQAAAMLLHTSGTMSSPKRVMLSHANITANAYAHAASVSASDRDRVLISLPMHFGYCNTAQVVAHLGSGGCLVLAGPGFSPGSYCRAIERDRITASTLVPTMLYTLAEYRHLRRHDLSSLRFIAFGGGPVRAEPLRALAKLVPHVDLVQTYGQTEAGPRITTRHRAHRRPESVGAAIDGVSVTIRTADGDTLTPGVVGEICVRSAGVMMGYYKRPRETAEVLRDRWLRTGDVGRLDDNGEIELLGRLRNTIMRAGISVHAEQIEEYLKSHPGVAEAAVLGERHATQGEVPVAYLVAAADSAVGDDELLRYCRRGLAAYKVPDRFVWHSELPKTYNQKIARGRLRGEAPLAQETLHKLTT